MKSFGFILVLCLLSSCVGRFTQNIPYDIPTNTLGTRIDSIVISSMNQYNISGLAICVIKDAAVLYSEGYGTRNIKTLSPVLPTSVFHTASISKLFTAIAIMQLVDEAQLSLDTRMDEVEHRFKNREVGSITVRQLLTHTSGLPDVSNYHWSNGNENEDSLEKYILGTSLKPKTTPGTTYNYSNLGYDLLGYIVQKVSGTSFEKYALNKVLIPGGMTSSDFRYFNIPESLRTTPHTKSWITGNVKVQTPYPYTREHAPSSTLNASVSDLGTWMISFMQSLNDSNHYYHTMLQPSTPLSPYMGLGFQLSELDGYKKVGHYGGDKGFRSYLMMIPQKEIGLVILANADYNEDFRQEILHGIARMLLQE